MPTDWPVSINFCMCVSLFVIPYRVIGWMRTLHNYGSGVGTVRWTDMNIWCWWKMMMKLTNKKLLFMLFSFSDCYKEFLLGINWARDIKLKTSKSGSRGRFNKYGRVLLLLRLLLLLKSLISGKWNFINKTKQESWKKVGVCWATFSQNSSISPFFSRFYFSVEWWLLVYLDIFWT